jgi:hypothetical protein
VIKIGCRIKHARHISHTADISCIQLLIKAGCIIEKAVHVGYFACAPRAYIPILLAYFTAGISCTALANVAIHCIK